MCGQCDALWDTDVSSGCYYSDICHLLPCQCPVSIAKNSERYAHAACHDESHSAYDGYLTVHHVLRHIPSMGYAQRGNEEAEEDEA